MDGGGVGGGDGGGGDGGGEGGGGEGGGGTGGGGTGGGGDGGGDKGGGRGGNSITASLTLSSLSSTPNALASEVRRVVEDHLVLAMCCASDGEPSFATFTITVAVVASGVTMVTD